ncbi:hypothetical protein HOK31_13310, partial [Candidatus Poribacteria bacterium]|nr:hypothetical protein [Candidatus Poribacteria bacterium]
MAKGLSTAIYRWTRDLHLYVGLAVGPFVLVFAISAIFFTHGWFRGGGSDSAAAAERVASFTAPPESEDSLVMAKAVLRQVGVAGEVGFVRRHQEPARLSILVETPGKNVDVDADLTTGLATIGEKRVGAWNGLIYLHKRPGMHNAHLRGSWFPMRLWGWVADATVYLTLFLTAS